MEYFMMEQDKRLMHLPRIRIPDGFLNREQRRDKNTPFILYVENLGLSCQYSDYLLQPFPMIGERIQGVMGKYQRDISFSRFILMDKETGLQHHYYGITAPEIDCACDEEPDGGSLGDKAEPVIDMDKTGGTAIFRTKQFKDALFVRLDAAESILRREPEGIWFTPVRAALSGNK
ncbi:hypothetical protein ADH76_11550 [Enterocloster clostridioformis]|uniref:hypothetical protein n=1 Tax=Enterocloster clostridioformis TaxID=1531 RepID=UPI00080CA468|nr:hypothetical protein [Enterocloster clostridioformis]ANU48254.1 hypothetical protein A4V08_23060 [Lachnoclostridium sp. YL32]NDO29498.1 hypothetical protein [Enterocloster clostridioformis]OXE69038.1 hypothetical protein ADH76_11550 [Enterocloster clostridioformis]QQR02860.1 hypothetical protein I5Q83_11755 [Enterocloster clostridioformis]